VTIDFENILFKLQNPKKVIPLFQFEVIGAERNDKLDKLLAKMKEHSFSQFPVFENGRVVEIITTNTISRWLSRNIIDNHIMEENPVIESLMGDIEFAKNYKFISRDENIYTAFNMFLSHIENNKRNLDAIFITQNGKSDQNLLGLITIEDIALQINAA
jgi:predicted transcriptional regulator